MSDDKTEDASEQKLRKAREEGNVAKSQDLTGGVAALAALAAVVSMGEEAAERVKSIVLRAIHFEADGLNVQSLVSFVYDALALGASVIFVPTIAAAVGALLAATVQVGVTISMKSVAPDLERISPASGLKKIFSIKSQISLIQMIVKAIILAAILYHLVVGIFPMLGASFYQAPKNLALIAWDVITGLLWTAVGFLLILGPFDFAVQRWQFLKTQKMSKDEVKREHKDSEGDPQIKGQRKAIARQDAQEAPDRSRRQASVVVVNPTHYAVGLHYVAGSNALPSVLFKGTEEEAVKLRVEAEAMGIPIVRHKPLAHALYRLKIEEEIPQELFEIIASILLWINHVSDNSINAPSDSDYSGEK